LKDQYKDFVSFYLGSGNASEAARKAGYSPKSAANIGCQLLKREEVRRAIERAKEAELKVVEDKATYQQKDVLDGLWRSANEYGKGTSHSARISAWRALGDALGVFKTPTTSMAKTTAIQINIVGADGSEKEIEISRQIKRFK
jgi:phage terminase small subunit